MIVKLKTIVPPTSISDMHVVRDVEAFMMYCRWRTKSQEAR